MRGFLALNDGERGEGVGRREECGVASKLKDSNGRTRAEVGDGAFRSDHVERKLVAVGRVGRADGEGGAGEGGAGKGRRGGMVVVVVVGDSY